MTSVGVALVNGVYKSGYVFAPGFVGDGSQLTDVHTSNVTQAVAGQLAYYVDSTTIGGDPGLSFVNGNLYVSGTTITSNNVSYESSVLSVGSTDDDEFTKGILLVNSHANVMISYTNVLTIGYTLSSTNDIKLFPKEDEDIHLNVLGNVSAKNFFGDASRLKNTIDTPDGTYGDGLSVPQITVTEGRPSVSLVGIQSSLESVTEFGTSTSKSIQFENEKVSLTTSGKVGIANSNPTTLLCVGDGVQISDAGACFSGGVEAATFSGNGASLTRTTDAYSGTYGDGLHIPQISVDKRGRISDISTTLVKTSLEKVTGYGSSTGAMINLTNKDVAMVTTGRVGIANSNPSGLLSVGDMTHFDDKNIYVGGNVYASQFVGNASQLTNIVDLKPGSYGNYSSIPQIIVDKNGRISDIIPINIMFSLDAVTRFNPSVYTTIQLMNKQNGLVSEGDIVLRSAKDLVFSDSFNNRISSIGQHSTEDSKTLNFSGLTEETTLTLDNWNIVNINSGLRVDHNGLTTMKGCFMESGTGYMMNAQQLSYSDDTVSLNKEDLFKWYTFSPKSGDKNVYLPGPKDCQSGSWIGITNISNASDIKVCDSSGETVYTVIYKSQFAGGNSCRLMCVSTLASANGTMIVPGSIWVVA
jgi:hypothetical protein